MKRVSACRVVLALSLVVVGLAGCPPDDRGAPQPSFTASPASGSPPLAVQFTDTSQPGISQIRSWFWEFGDGSTSTLRNPSHIYYAPGAYSVSLSVTTAVGTRRATFARYITVAEPGTVAQVGVAGGSLQAEGVRLQVPPAALDAPVVLGIAKTETAPKVDAAAGERIVSTPVAINHNRPEALSLHPDKPIVMRFIYTLAMVPSASRKSPLLQVLARQDDGSTIPILGEVDGDAVRICVTGLPRTAIYAVALRPAAQEEEIAVQPPPAKETTSYTWPSGVWRVSYTPQMLQAATALRVGTIADPLPYDNRNFSDGAVATTQADIRAAINRIHAWCRDAGFIAPRLCAGANNALSLILHPFNDPPRSRFPRLADVPFAVSPYGGIVIDPEQLIAICKKNAEAVEDDALPLLADRRQELDFANAFAQELFRAIYRGYDFPIVKAASPSDLDSSGRARAIPFSQAYCDGLAAFLGQLASNVRQGLYFIPRSMGHNEFAMLDEPLFAPFAASSPAYSYAAQDFLFYLLRGLSSAPSTPDTAAAQVLAFLADSYEGVLELIRTNESALANQAAIPSFRDATLAANRGLELAFKRAFGPALTLADVYWNYARGRAYDNPSAGTANEWTSFLRPTDALDPDGFARQPYQLNLDRFSPNAVTDVVISQANLAQEISHRSVPMLDNIPPLSTRALILTAQSVYGELDLTLDAFAWTPDADGNSMKVLVCENGKEGVELSPENARVIYDDFNGATGPSELIVLLSNVTADRFYSASLSATIRTGEAGATGFLLGYVTDAATTDPIGNVAVEVRRKDNGSLLGSTKTGTSGILNGVFYFPSLPVVDVEITLTKTGYQTRKVNAQVTPGTLDPSNPMASAIMISMTSSR